MIRAVLCAALAACPSRAPAPEPATRELVVALVEDWDATRAEMRRWRQSPDGSWRALGDAWPAVVGRTGVAWGSGLHGDGAPAGRSGPVKREGDGKSPAGVFALRGAYGYSEAAPAGTRVPYTVVDEHWKCVDDPRSRSYDRIVDERTVTPDWASAEEMRRPDDMYRWTIDVAHNGARVPGAGSCIFLHVWGGPGVPTTGCTAMAEPALATLLASLDPGAEFVLLPRAEYAALAARWGLPPVTSR